MRFWAPQAPLYAFSGALQPFTASHTPESGFRGISQGPGPASGPRGRAGSRRRGQLGGGRGRKALPTHQRDPRGRTGWERQWKFGDVSFVCGPGEKESRGAGGPQRGLFGGAEAGGGWDKGVPDRLGPSLRREAQDSERDLPKGPDLQLEGVYVASSHKITLLCRYSAAQPPRCFTNSVSREGRGIWGDKTTDSSSLRRGEQKAAGCPGSTTRRWGRGNTIPRLLRGSGGPVALGAASGREKPPSEALPPPQHPGGRQARRSRHWSPFSHGKPLENGSAELRLSGGQEGGGGTQLSAKEVRGAPTSGCCFASAAGVPIAPPMGRGGRGGRLGGRWRSTRLPGCSSSRCSAPFTTSGSSRR